MPQNTYIRTTWVNDSDPPLSADNLNKIEQGIVDAHIHMAAKNNPHGCHHGANWCRYRSGFECSH